jgi:diketogulonate reductase-like aldo/keto reductase
MAKVVNHYLTLNTGGRMPMIGLGTWNADRDKVDQAIDYAISECGYRQLDCAAVYHNEKEIGESLGKIFAGGKIKREEVFITSKLWNHAHAKENVAAACKDTLQDLKLEYLDLYLVHWGVAVSKMAKYSELVDEDGFLITEKVPMQETWVAMEDLKKSGLVKNIGVANFTAPMIIDLLSYARVIPVVNQIELHPYLQQTALVEFCQYKGIAVTAYSPLGSPAGAEDKPLLLEDKTINEIARRHGKSPAQVLIRWAVERNTGVIPKSTTPERIKENIEVFDFELSKEDKNAISKLDRKLRYVDPVEWWKIPYFDS